MKEWETIGFCGEKGRIKKPILLGVNEGFIAWSLEGERIPRGGRTNEEEEERERGREGGREGTYLDLSGAMNQSGSGVWEGGCSRKQGMRYKVAQAPHQNLSEWTTPTPPCHIKEREKERERERERSHLLAYLLALPTKASI